MPQISYKNYLDYIRQKSKPPVLKKSIWALFVIFCLTLGSSSAFFFYQQRQTRLSQEDKYREVALSSFTSSRESIDEVLESFKVAGEKIEVIEDQKESTGSAIGFYASIEDLAKTIAKIESAQKNIEYQKVQLEAVIPSDEHLKLHTDLEEYFDSAHNLLGEILRDHQDALQFSLASGEKFYLPILTNESLWQTGDKSQILGYYENVKNDANIALEKYSKLSASEDFKEYQKDQIAYIEQAVNIADGIILLLNTADSENPDEVTQMEKAYQLLNSAKGENEVLFQSITAQKLEVTSFKKAIFMFAQVTLAQNSIEAQMNELFGGFTK